MTAFIHQLRTGTIAVIVALALTVTAATPAQAQTTTIAQLQAQINALLAQIAALQGGTAVSAGYTFTRDLTIGSTGADVTALQQFLIARGYAIPAGATGYFGTQTQAALASYQAANGINPPAGYFGPITRGHINALTPSPTTPTPTTPSDDDDDFEGDEEGYLDDFEDISSLSNEEVGEDETAEVLGVEFEAVDADQMISRVTVEIDTPSGNDDLEDFIEEVVIMLDGEELDSMDIDDASYSRNADRYTFRFTNLDGIVDEGDIGELTVAVTAVSNIDSDDEGDSWTIRIPADGIRAVSPNGVDDTYDSAAHSTTFTVETFAAATDLELSVTEGDDNPEEGVVAIDDEGDEIVLLQFALTAEDSDITIFDLPFDLTSTGGDVEDLIDELMLEWDGDDASENVANGNSTSQTVTFDDLDIELSEGDTVEFTLIGRSATSSPSGATLSADLDTANIDAEDQTGEDIAAADIDGTANGETQHLFNVVPEIEVLSTDIDPIDNGDAPPESALAMIEVRLTARGGAIYLNGDDESTAADEFFVVGVSGGNASTTISSWTHTLAGSYTVVNSGADNEYYRVDEDRSITVRITGVVFQQTVTTTSVLAGMMGTAIQFGTDSTDQTTRSQFELDWTDLTDQLKTGNVVLTNPS